MDIFYKLKKIDNFGDLKKNSIYLSDGSGYLMPISKYFLNQNERILDLTNWRNLNSFAYPTVFTATSKSTLTWLENNLLNNNNKILFFVVDKYEKYIGHIGLNIPEKNNQTIEIDNVSRGNDSSKGIMTNSSRELINWTFRNCKTKEITLRVLKSNSNAINFYKKLGFSYLSEVPLYKKINKEGYVLHTKDDYIKIHKEIDNNLNPSDFFITMKYQQN